MHSFQSYLAHCGWSTQHRFPVLSVEIRERPWPPILSSPKSQVRIKHVNLPHFDLSITLEPNATGTLVTWVGEFENHEFAEKMRQFMEGANEQNLNRLAKEIAAGPR